VNLYFLINKATTGRQRKSVQQRIVQKHLNKAMETLIPEPIPKHRYKQLHCLRGLAALTVFFGHFLGIKLTTPFFVTLSKTPLSFLLNANAAVMFFFVLSGFVLSLPFVNGEKPLKLAAFYTKRVLRIYPAFIFAVLGALALKEFVYDKTAVASFSDWVGNYWNWDFTRQSIPELLKTLLLIGPDFKPTLIHVIDAPIWSLVIEMKMSIILPFFIMIISRGSVTLNIVFLLIIAHLTYRYDAWAISIFYMGILMAKYREPVIQSIMGWNWVVLIFAVIVGYVLYNQLLLFLTPFQHSKIPFKNIYSNYLTATGSCLLMMIVLAKQKLSNFFEHRIFAFFGDISYSFYLIHLPILATVASLIANRYTFGMYYIFIITLTLSIIIAYLMFIFIERPFQRLSVKLVNKYKILNRLQV
jgi:peptidoglycan/LPS O-acetylase OafA/YrhL